MPLQLDTNHVSYLLKGDPSVTQGFRDNRHEAVVVSAVTVGELLSGARYTKSAHLEMLIRQFLEEIEVMSADAAVAEHYADIRAHLWSVGQPIPDNDIWIAATARRHGYRLIARDRHFRHVPGLQLESWYQEAL